MTTDSNVIPFVLPKDAPVIEHVDSSTIVERLELTPELRKEFEAAGYTFEDDDNGEANKDK